MISAHTVKNEARSLGFDLCGIAPAAGFPELAFFETWLACGYAGSMDYLRRSAEYGRSVL
jgi:epoxyqueuosine reductase QueG